MNYSEDLKAYLDGELSAARVAEIDARLAVDGDLRKELGELRAIGQALGSVSVPASVGMEATLIRLQTGRQKPVWLRPVLALAACAVIFAVFFPMTMRGASEDSADLSVVAMKSQVADIPSSVAASPPIISLPQKRNDLKADSRGLVKDEALTHKNIEIKAKESTSRKPSEVKVSPRPLPRDPALPVKTPDVSSTIASATAGVAAFASQPVVTVTVASVDDAERRIRDWARDNGGAVSDETSKFKDTSARKDSIVTVTVDEPNAERLLSFLKTVDRPVPAPTQIAAMDSVKANSGRVIGGFENESQTANRTQETKVKAAPVAGSALKSSHLTPVRKTIRIKLVVKPPAKSEPE